MKKITRILSLLLAVAMVLSLNLTTITALASGYTVTINGDTTGHTYEAYQIFTGTLSDEGVLSDIEWGSGINGSSFLEALQKASEDSDSDLYGRFPSATCTSAADVAKALADATSSAQKDSDVAKAFADLAGQYLTITKTESVEDPTYTYKISGLAAGYYFIKDKDDSMDGADDAYTRFILEVVKDVDGVTPKSSTPTVDKEVQENTKYSNNDGYNDVADYSIGDDVPFRLTGTMPSTLADYTKYKYIFHDTMVDGLTFNNSSVTVTIGTTDVPATTTVNGESYTNYTLAYKDGTTEPTDGCTFEVRFTDVLALYDKDGNKIDVTNASTIVVDYTATLNSDAIIGLDGNENKVLLEYSNNPNTGGEGDTGKTPEKKVIVFTYEIDVTKQDGSTKTGLANVEFKLYKIVTEQGVDVKYYAIVDNDSKITGWTTTENDGSKLTSGSGGTFKIVGLDDGTYYLTETKALDGYNTIDDIKLTIIATTTNGTAYTGTPGNALTKLELSVNDGTATEGSTSTGVVSTTVDNNKGTTLPETGGMGTKIFYTLGGLLVVCAGLLLIVKRRMRNA